MESNKDTAADRSKKKQATRRNSECMTHEEAEGAVPEDMAVAGEEDGGAGIQHWRDDDVNEDAKAGKKAER